MFSTTAVRILSVVVIALSLFIAPAAAKPRDKQAPTTPTNLHIAATGPASISLAWNASKDNSTNWWYVVEGCDRAWKVDPPSTTYTNSALPPGQTFTCWVYAIDAAGNRSGNSNTVTYTTPADTNPPSAPVMSVSGVFPTRAFLSWTESVDPEGGWVLYSLFINGSPIYTDVFSAQSYWFLHLTPSTHYMFQVSVRDMSFNTTTSTVTVTTPAKTESTPPTAPTDLKLGFQSSEGEMWLSWSPSTDDTTPQSQILYDVYLDGELENETDGNVGATNTIAYCRTEDGPTVITLVAVDTSGNVSAPSNAIPFEC